jgi:mRNA interferase RelE/StbE
VKKSAVKEIEALPPKIILHVTTAIGNLADSPRPQGCKKLKGAKEDLWRIRIGDYRVVYIIRDSIQILEIQKVGHRKDIYE